MNRNLAMEPVVSRSRFLPWAGVVVLGASWLPGLGYFHPVSGFTAAMLVLVGALLMCGGWIPAATERAKTIQSIVAIFLMLPILWFVPWAYKSAPLLLVIGAVILAMEPPRGWARNLAGGALAAGVVLLAQSLALMTYEALTARSHELPLVVGQFLGWIAHMLGNDAAVSANTPGGGGGVDIALRTMRKNHHLGATWELLVDPVTLGFVAGGLGLVMLRGRRLGGAIVLLVCVLAWLPVRAGILMALVLHRALRTDFDAPLKVMDAFYSPWMLMLLVLPVALLVWKFVRMGGEEVDHAANPRNEFRGLWAGAGWNWWAVISPVLVALAVGVFTVAVLYDPIGVRKGGRVIVDEYHTRWEPTQIPFDTKVYGHDSGYNYAAIYDYSSRFYKMSRLLGPGIIDERDPRMEPLPPAASQPTGPAITDAVLEKCDVFILKCPTSRLRADEIECLKWFVAKGGGLLLVGEHTDVFGLGTNLNDVARPFGFQFRYDILFNIDDEHPFDYLYNKPLVPHPIVQRMPPLDFEGPCTIEPTGGAGQAVMLAVGQRGEPAHYYASNFMPPPEDRADARYGAWIVLWSTKFGDGRVVAHADSTQWSNFSAFEAGKPESWMGMIEWLNHKNGMVANPRMALGIFGIMLLLGGIFGNRLISRFAKGAGDSSRNREATDAGQSNGEWLVMIGAGMFAFVIAATSVRAIHSAAMPVPERKKDVEMINVGIDRAVSDAVISKGGFIGGLANGYGIFERWILRLGWFTQRGGAELLQFEGPNKKDMVVYLLPAKDVTEEYRERLVKYVENGGRVLVIDTPENPRSTANSLLKPFGMELRRPYTPLTGDIVSTLGLATTQAPNIYEVTGIHETLAMVGGKAAAGTARYGKGTVTAIGFGARFSDTNFGVTGDVNPGEEMLKLYEMQYGLLRHLMGQPVEIATTRPATMPIKN